MSDRMMKMMMNKKKQGKSLSDSEKKSKLEALMGMKQLADSHMGNKLKNLKKVTVASNTPEGLKAGLHKAEDMAEQDPSDEAASDLEDSDSDLNKFSEGGNVYDRGDSGGHVAHMPEGFATDEDAAVQEAKDMEGSGDMEPGYDEGTENSDPSMSANSDDDSQPESVDEIVQDADHLDPQELQELIDKLKMKLGNS